MTLSPGEFSNPYIAQPLEGLYEELKDAEAEGDLEKIRLIYEAVDLEISETCS